MSSFSNKKILIPQKRIEVAHAPYVALADKYGLSVDFHPFTSMGSVSVADFRKYKQDIMHKKAALLFTNKIAIDYFFRLVEAIKVKISADIRYFCATEQLKNYLQKYITIKQRKVVYGRRGVSDIFPKIKKFKDLNFLFPCSNLRQHELYDFFKDNGLTYKEVKTYETRFNDLSGLSEKGYDLILFFSPMEVEAMKRQLPNFKAKGMRIAVFGKVTANAVKEAGWEADVHAPSVEAPSLVGALDIYFDKVL